MALKQLDISQMRMRTIFIAMPFYDLHTDYPTHPQSDHQHFLSCLFLSDYVCLFDLILYVQVNNLSVTSGWAFLG